MTFDQHVGSCWAVLGFPKNLVLTAVHPRAGPGHELGGEQVCHRRVRSPERPRHGPWRPLGMTPAILRPERWLAIGEHRPRATAIKGMNGRLRARLNLSLIWRRRTTNRQNQDQSSKSGAAPPRIAFHDMNTPAGQRSFPALCAEPTTIPEIGDNQRLQIVDKTEKEFMSAIGLMEKKR